MLEFIKNLLETLGKMMSGGIDVSGVSQSQNTLDKIVNDMKEDDIKVELPKEEPKKEVTKSSGVKTLSKNGIMDIMNYEGFSSKPYLCSANEKTVGFGSTKSDIPDLPKWSWDKEISVQEGVSLFKKGSTKYINAVNKALKVPVTQPQFDALVSLAYNIGTGGITNSGLMKKINAKAPMAQQIAALKSWNKVTVGGKKVTNKGLVNRRAMEAETFSKGVYQTRDGSVTNISVNAKTHKPSYKGRIKVEPYL